MTKGFARKRRASLLEGWSVTGFRDLWLVVHAVRAVWAGVTYEAPVGFPTDLASVPKIFRFIIPAHGRYTAGAIIHDRLYATHEVERHVADAVFLGVMLENGTRIWRAFVMFATVRMFGAKAWKNGPAKLERLTHEAGLDDVPLGE